MIYESMFQPKYANESDHSIHLYSSMAVAKELYDLLWPHFVNFIPEMHFGSSYTVYDFLGSSGMLDFLNDEGINTAEKCLEHIAIAELLPIVIDEKSDGFTFFKSRC